MEPRSSRMVGRGGNLVVPGCSDWPLAPKQNLLADHGPQIIAMQRNNRFAVVTVRPPLMPAGVLDHQRS